MKKVENILSSARKQLMGKRCAAVFSAAAVLFTSLTFTVHYSAEAKAANETLKDGISSQKILELSESFLSLKAENNISVLEVSGFRTPESESVVFIEELSTGSEGDREVTTEKSTEKVTEAVTEKTTEKETTTKAPVTTQKVEVTQAPATTQKPVQATPVVKESGQYTFEELGLSQISDIEVPDDILFDENGVPLNYSRKLSGVASAYHMGHTTSTGTSVHPGVVAVNPNIIPYGSKMYIVTDDGWVYGYSSAEDTGGFIYWDNAPIADLYVSSVDFAYQWGRRSVTIYIF